METGVDGADEGLEDFERARRCILPMMLHSPHLSTPNSAALRTGTPTFNPQAED